MSKIQYSAKIDAQAVMDIVRTVVEKKTGKKVKDIRFKCSVEPAPDNKQCGVFNYMMIDFEQECIESCPK